MAETIGTAYVQIEPSFDGVVSQIDKEMGGAGSSGGRSFSSGFSTALKGGGLALAATGAAVGAVTSKLVTATSEVASYGDNIDKMSQKMGLTAEAYQEWDAVMQHSGTSMESMKSSMKTLANAAESNNAAFEKIGLTQEEIANMSQQDLFEATIAGLQNVEDSTERTYLAGKLLGRGATELGALLNMSADETQAMRDRVRELGGVMSDDAVTSSAKFQDQLQDMQTAFSGLSRGLTAEFLPGMTQVMSGLTEIFSGNSDAGIQQISEGVQNVVSGITEHLPEIAETGTQIVEALATAIIDNLPELVSAGMDIISELCSFIIDNLPELLQAGLEIILELATGIAEALPELIPAIVETIMTIVDYLIDNIDLLIDAAIAIIIGLADGLIEALPKLIEKAPEIIIKLVEALIRNAPKLLSAGITLIGKLIEGVMKCWTKIFQVGKDIVDKIKEGFWEKIEKAKEWGKDLIQNFIDGILDKFEDLKKSVKKCAEAVKEFLGFSEPEKGPLSDFHTYAPDMMNMFAKGITDNVDVVQDALTDATAGMMNTTIDPTVMQTVSAQAGNAAAAGGADLYGLLSQYLPLIAQGENVRVTLEGDANGLFNAVRKSNDSYKRQTGVSAFA